jgi:hypothetical protein
VTFWYGAGSSYPYLGQTDPDPALFVSDLQDGLDGNKKLLFFCWYFLKVHLHHSSQIKILKKSQKIEIKGLLA